MFLIVILVNLNKDRHWRRNYFKPTFQNSNCLYEVAASVNLSLLALIFFNTNYFSYFNNLRLLSNITYANIRWIQKFSPKTFSIHKLPEVYLRSYKTPMMVLLSQGAAS